jgi:hypothetical protein
LDGTAAKRRATKRCPTKRRVSKRCATKRHSAKTLRFKTSRDKMSPTAERHVLKNVANKRVGPCHAARLEKEQKNASTARANTLAQRA